MPCLNTTSLHLHLPPPPFCFPPHTICFFSLFHVLPTPKLIFKSEVKLFCIFHHTQHTSPNPFISPFALPSNPLPHTSYFLPSPIPHKINTLRPEACFVRSLGSHLAFALSPAPEKERDRFRLCPSPCAKPTPSLYSVGPGLSPGRALSHCEPLRCSLYFRQCFRPFLGFALLPLICWSCREIWLLLCNICSATARGPSCGGVIFIFAFFPPPPPPPPPPGRDPESVSVAAINATASPPHAHFPLSPHPPETENNIFHCFLIPCPCPLPAPPLFLYLAQSRSVFRP